MLHKHHTIPKHAGGKDSPTVLLTIEEHAEAHRKLWEQYGRWQDWLAWKMLSGHIPFDEGNRIKFAEGGRHSYPFLRASKQGTPVKGHKSEVYKIIASKNTGQKRSAKTKQAISERQKRSWELRYRNGRDKKPPHSTATKDLLSIVRTQWNEEHRYPHICEDCGEDFVASSPMVRFCSARCKAQHGRRQKGIPTNSAIKEGYENKRRSFICDECKEPFIASWPHAKFCSGRCKARYARKIKRSQ